MRNNLKELRVKSSLTQKQLGDAVGTSGEQIRKLETGQRQISPVWAEKLSLALNIKPPKIYGWHNWQRSTPPKNIEVDKMKYPNRLRQLRKAMNSKMSQTDLAEAVGTSTQNISFYERGERKLPTHIASKLSEILNVSPATLYGWEDQQRASDTIAQDRLNEVCNELSLTAEEIAANTSYTQSDIKHMLDGSAAITESFVQELEKIIPRMESGELVDYILHHQEFISKIQRLNRHQLKAINALIEQMIGK